MESIDFVFSDRATVPGFLGMNCQQALLDQIMALNPDKILFVTETNVDCYHANYFKPLLDTDLVEKRVLPSGDEAKSWEHLHELVSWNFAIGATKKSVIVAFGGGALLNVAGLFASITYRGMRFVSVPTTFLAMHDVVTSLKTSICFDGRKNNVGTFYAPTKILIDVAFCETLPAAELFSGLGELAKNACLFGGEHAEGFTAALKRQSRLTPSSSGEFELDMHSLLDLTRLGIKAKMDVLLHDAYEKQFGMIFEYGHTVSHAIEKAYGDGVIPHGLGVVYGMLSCSFVAERLGFMTAGERETHDALCHLLLSKWPLPTPMPTAEMVYARAMKDSKRGIAGETPTQVSDVMLYRLGEIHETPTSNLYAFDSTLLLEWLLQMGFPSETGQCTDEPGACQAAGAVA